LKETESGRVFVCESSQPIRSHSVFGGFLQLSGELTLLPLISQALDCEPRERKPISAKLVRCKYVKWKYRGEEENVVALLIDYGDGKVKVRCPDMMFRGSRICGETGNCPYGEILYP